MKIQSWQKHNEKGSPILIKLITKIALNFPRAFARLWLYPITIYFFIKSRSIRLSSAKYFSHLGKTTNINQNTLKHIFTFASVLLDRIYFLTNKYALFNIEVTNLSVINNLIDKNQGALLLGCHIGSFDALQYLSTKHKKANIKIAMDINHNSLITNILYTLNPKVANNIIDIKNDNFILKLKEEIESGSLVGMLGDRNLDNKRNIDCTILENNVEISSTPFIISHILNTPIVTFFGIYLGKNKYKILFKKIEIDYALSRDEYVKQASVQYVNGINNIIKKYPYNWFNFYNYWNDIQ